jgi:hypothetical protein
MRLNYWLGRGEEKRMVLIDMEMPGHCEECPLNDEYAECAFLGKFVAKCGRLPDCPLREVEDPWLDLQKKLERWMAEKKIKFYSIDDEYLDTDDIKREVEG